MEKEKYIAPEVTYVEFNFKDRITQSNCWGFYFQGDPEIVKNAEAFSSTMGCRDSW